MGQVKEKPYGVQALDIELGIEIPLSAIVDYDGERMVRECTADHAQGAAPHNPCHCAGARIVEELFQERFPNSDVRAAICLSRAYVWVSELEQALRCVMEGGVQRALDGGDSPIGEKMIIKKPKRSIRLGERDPPDPPSPTTPGSHPKRGNRINNPRVQTVLALRRQRNKRKKKT